MITREPSDRPAYRQLAELLHAAIIRGDYEPGQSLPSETRLMQRHQVARVTVRQAMEVLRDEGLVVTQQGLGTYVRINFAGLFARATTEVLGVKTIPATAPRWDSGFLCWQDTGKPPAGPAAKWAAIVLRTVKRPGGGGVPVRRLLLLPDGPHSDYVRYVLEDCATNVLAGEDVRVALASEHPAPCCGQWMLDRRTVIEKHDGPGGTVTERPARAEDLHWAAVTEAAPTLADYLTRTP